MLVWRVEVYSESESESEIMKGGMSESTTVSSDMSESSPATAGESANLIIATGWPGEPKCSWYPDF